MEKIGDYSILILIPIIFIKNCKPGPFQDFFIMSEWSWSLEKRDFSAENYCAKVFDF